MKNENQTWYEVIRLKHAKLCYGFNLNIFEMYKWENHASHAYCCLSFVKWKCTNSALDQFVLAKIIFQSLSHRSLSRLQFQLSISKHSTIYKGDISCLYLLRESWHFWFFLIQVQSLTVHMFWCMCSFQINSHYCDFFKIQQFGL